MSWGKLCAIVALAGRISYRLGVLFTLYCILVVSAQTRDIDADNAKSNKFTARVFYELYIAPWQGK